MYRPELSWRKQLVPVAIVVFWVGLGCVACMMYERYKFPPGTTDPNAEFARNYGDIWTPNPIPGLTCFAFSFSCGIFFYCPVLYLALRGWNVWRRREPVFCWSVVAASLLFILFLSFVTYFKGEHGWGPRYLTPMFALWWLFTPNALSHVRAFVMRGLLAAGIVIQLLGLSVDPTRLFLATPIPLDYFVYDPWLTFHPSLSHLLQRPREIIEVISRHDPEPQFAPAPLPTHAGGLHDVQTCRVAQMVAASFSPEARNINPVIHTYTSVIMSGQATVKCMPGIYQQTARNYHIYNSLRPWWICQRVLPQSQRPVSIGETVLLLLGLGGVGIFLMRLSASRLPAVGRKPPAGDISTAINRAPPAVARQLELNTASGSRP